ncbi:diaminopimelate epimerase [Robertkochia solimangrovi]|uniref:diaminopimelate epimerase n=1 Tax=Robertkochia solimangrovi TaxID=2213046 RepID=UPI00117DB43B|nr:diaminopimelate epimerase [Robertkochia solimangrovi]TRZ41101.1 diaminopimelate epimerase [Robertkochia solimangrovi]
MKINFYKYQGTGNDFVMIDNRQSVFPKNDTKLINHLCDRRFGIGADGLILLENDPEYDFKMVYYNADGRESTMCGNGGRCLVAFASQLGVIENEATFIAVDGLHKARITGEVVELQMQDVKSIDVFEKYSFLNTGSPHHVQLQNELKHLDVKKEGARLRYGKYGEEGSNINFTEQIDADTFAVRTYERGVEDETYSCGTGVTAVAIAMHRNGLAKGDHIALQTPGGNLSVSFETSNGHYNNVWLKGPAKLVYSGTIAY